MSLQTTPRIARHFVVDCPGVPGTGLFNFQNLLQGRVDNACRVVTAALFLSHGMRQDTSVSLVLPHPQQGSNRTVTVTWVGNALVGVWPDEKSIATRLQRALCHHFGTPCPQPADKRAVAVPNEGVKGVSVVSDPPTAGSKPCGVGFGGAVERATASVGAATTIYLLDEAGAPRAAFDAAATAWAQGTSSATENNKLKPSGFVFVIGGPDGLSPAATAAVIGLGATTLRLPGPSLHAGSVVTLLHSVLDAAVDEVGAEVSTAPVGAVAARQNNDDRRNRRPKRKRIDDEENVSATTNNNSAVPQKRRHGTEFVPPREHSGGAFLNGYRRTSVKFDEDDD